ncbi:hypothetical protein [Campylobacter hyointestinalis]|uniref:hypothetical protein n=1 Tax=Campylobacter hyointestinalis TaxID=198 RepID=UPI0015EC2FEA|nr:hypothetical protein [Campylobacter hyointestinalis]
MANISKACLSDKDIELLETKDILLLWEILRSLKFISILKEARFFQLLFMRQKT